MSLIAKGWARVLSRLFKRLLKPSLKRLLAVALAAAPFAAAAQGTWMQTLCLAGTASAGTSTGSSVGASAGISVPPCKATPAWGQTGVEHVQALAAAAGPGNLGLSLVKPETLPAANAARAQGAAVMLGYLDGDRPASSYRWFGPVASPSTGTKTAGYPYPAPPSITPARSSDSSAVATEPTAPAAAATAPKRADSLQAAWLAGARGDEPQTRSASWWLASPYLASAMPAQADAAADPYRVLRFLAAQCPQLEGKVAPNAWTRCTSHQVAEPGSAALAGLALLLAAASRRRSGSAASGSARHGGNRTLLGRGADSHL